MLQAEFTVPSSKDLEKGELKSSSFQGNLKVKWNQEELKNIVSSNLNREIYYSNGPIFQVSECPNVKHLASFEKDVIPRKYYQSSSIISGDSGLGKVFLVSPHPEKSDDLNQQILVCKFILIASKRDPNNTYLYPNPEKKKKKK